MGPVGGYRTEVTICQHAVVTVLEQLALAHRAVFGADLTEIALETTDTAWSWRRGQLFRADSGSLVAGLSGRVLPGGRGRPRA